MKVSSVPWADQKAIGILVHHVLIFFFSSLFFFSLLAAAAAAAVLLVYADTRCQYGEQSEGGNQVCK